MLDKVKSILQKHQIKECSMEHGFEINRNEVFDPINEEQIQLYKMLRGLRRKGVNILDMNVLVGKKAKMGMRIIAIRVPVQIEQQRKRKMRKDKLEKRSKDYLEMLGWCIYVTNISQEILEPKQIQQMYGYRWRIEMIFKCWKSNINLNYFLSDINLAKFISSEMV